MIDQTIVPGSTSATAANKSVVWERERHQRAVQDHREPLLMLTIRSSEENPRAQTMSSQTTHERSRGDNPRTQFMRSLAFTT